MSEPTTAAGRALGEALPRFFRAHAYWRDFEPSVDDRIAAIEAEAAAAARTALLDELEAAVRGLEPTGDAGYYDDRWVNRADVLAEINRRRP